MLICWRMFVLVLLSNWEQERVLAANCKGKRISHSEGGNLPGFHIRISSKGLSYVNAVSAKILSSAIKSLKFENQNIGLFGEIKNIRISRFTPPKFSYQFLNDDSLRWSASGGHISIAADSPLKATGSIEGLSLSADVKLARSPSGGPQLNVAQCKADVNRASITLGLVPIPVDLSSIVKPLLSSQVCNFLQNDVNTKLDTFPTSVRIGDNDRNLIDYSLTSDPAKSGNGLMSSHKGQITRMESKYPLAFNPPPIPMELSDSKMFYAYGSEYMINYFLLGQYKNGLAERGFYQRHSKTLRLSCDSNSQPCLETVFPGISRKYPNSNASLILDATGERVPSIRVKNGKIFIDWLGRLKIRIKQEHPTRIAIVFAADGRISTEITVEYKMNSENRLRALCSASLRPNSMKILNPTSSVRSKFTNEDIEDLIKRFATPTFENIVNGHLLSNKSCFEARPWDEYSSKLPITSGIRFRNFGIRLLNGYGEFSTDIDYVAT